MADDEDIASRETYSDDEDRDDDDDGNLDDGSMEGSVDVSKPGGELTHKKDKVKLSARPKAVKKRKKRKMKPKDYPKRPLSAYNIFFKQTREKNLEEHGRLNFQEMVKKVAAQWKEITPETKTKYQDLAAEDLARYKIAVGAYERDMVERSRLEREEASKTRKALLAEEERKTKQAKNESVKRSPAMGTAGGWEERTLASGNQYLSQSVRIPMGDNPHSLEHPMINSHHHRDGFLSNGIGGSDLGSLQSRIQEEFRSMEEARSIQLRRFELAQAGGISPEAASAALQTSGRGGMIGSLEPSELNLQQARYLSAAGGDAFAAANEAIVRERLALIRNPDFSSEREARLLQEARLAAMGHPGFSAGGSLNPFSSLFAQLPTTNQYEEALFREQLLRRQEHLLRAGMGAGATGSLFGYPGSTFHSSLGGGVGGQSFADFGYSGAPGTGLSSLGVGYDPLTRVGMGLTAEDRLSALGRLSDDELLRSLSRQATGKSLGYPPQAGDSNNKGVDSTD